MNQYKYHKNPGVLYYHYAKHGLLHKNRVCHTCRLMPMRLVKTGGGRYFGFPLQWSCIGCCRLETVTSNGPMQYIDLKVFDAALVMWLESISSTIGDKVLRGRVSRYYRVFRKASSGYLRRQVLPFLSLPGPVEVDESKIGAERWSQVGRYPKKVRWVLGMICRTTKIPVVY